MHEWPKRRLHLTDAQAPNYKFEHPIFSLIVNHGLFFTIRFHSYYVQSEELLLRYRARLLEHVFSELHKSEKFSYR